MANILKFDFEILKINYCVTHAFDILVLLFSQKGIVFLRFFKPYSVYAGLSLGLRNSIQSWICLKKKFWAPRSLHFFKHFLTVLHVSWYVCACVCSYFTHSFCSVEKITSRFVYLFWSGHFYLFLNRGILITHSQLN